MTLTRRDAPAQSCLSAEDERLLRGGPAIAPMPSRSTHDRLRALWVIHGPTIIATTPRGQSPWFVARDAFVRIVRREDH